MVNELDDLEDICDLDDLDDKSNLKSSDILDDLEDIEGLPNPSMLSIIPPRSFSKKYTRCCSCLKPMPESDFCSCTNCYQYYLRGGLYYKCNMCGKDFNKPKKYGTCFECYQKLKNGGE